MIAGHFVVDAHLHPARLSTLKIDRHQWVRDFGDGRTRVEQLFDDDGTLMPEQFDAHLAEQGVDVALLFCEYSPRVTGIQPVEDVLPFLEYNPHRFRLVANINPHVHHPRTCGIGASGCLGGGRVKAASGARRLRGQQP